MVVLNDEEVKRQIDHMVSFINLEASEKVQEIDARAEEEFNIEKGRLVQQERLRILNLYEKKEKQLCQVKRIMHSQYLNSSRINILKSQDEIINNVLKEAHNRLAEISRDAEYESIFSRLLLQSFYQILESNIVVSCREVDLKLLQKILEPIKAEFTKNTKIKINCKISDIYLPPDCSGGVIVKTENDRIYIDNTLDRRIEFISKQLMPNLRLILLGRNKNRTHTT